jgi:hypothetical protein
LNFKHPAYVIGHLITNIQGDGIVPSCVALIMLAKNTRCRKEKSVRHGAPEKRRKREHHVDVSFGITGNGAKNQALPGNDCFCVMRKFRGSMNDGVQFLSPGAAGLMFTLLLAVSCFSSERRMKKSPLIIAG